MVDDINKRYNNDKNGQRDHIEEIGGSADILVAMTEKSLSSETFKVSKRHLST